MQHRVRAAGLVVRDGAILLVKHRRAGDDRVWWSPPGGGVEGAESVLQCAAREVWEETGLAVTADRVVYLREYLDAAGQCHTLEVYVLATAPVGEPSTGAVAGTPDAQVVRDARFVAPAELTGLEVFPRELRDTFWYDHEAGFPRLRYLGIHRA